MKFLLTMPNNAIEAMLKKRGNKVAKHIDDSFDVMLFPGGPDITPFLYGERKSKWTMSCDFRRDMMENFSFRQVPLDFPKIGICRGAQMLHVLSGGTLWQHVDNHAGKGFNEHEVYDVVTKKSYRVTSSHHQMMRPMASAKVIAGTNTASYLEADRIYRKLDKRASDDILDLEVVWHPTTRSLCFQGHPEYNLKECENYFFELIERYIEPQAQCECH